MLPGNVAVIPADRVGGGQRIIGKLIVFRDGPHQGGGGFPVRQLFSQERVEHRTGGIKGLHLILNVQGGKNIFREIHRQVGAVGVIGSLSLFSGRFDLRPFSPVVLGQPVAGGFRRGGLQIVKIPVLLLVLHQTLPHVAQHIPGESLGGGIGHILSQPAGVEARLIHAHQADGGKMIGKAAQIPFCVRIQSLVQQAGDHLSLYLQGAGGEIHHVIQTAVKLFFIPGQIRDPGHIDGDHAHGPGALPGAEVSSGLLPQFPQIQPEAATHGAHVAGLHIAVDIVGEIRGSVLAGHLEQQAVVLRIGPVEIRSDGVGGNGVLEAPSVGVSFDHGLDESLVDHIHLFFAVFVAEIHFLSPYDGRQLRQILGHGPVQGDVGERRLGPPAAGGVDPVDKGLNAFFHLRVGLMIRLDKRRQVRVKGRKSLGPRPLVLHDPQEVYHLVAEDA